MFLLLHVENKENTMKIVTTPSGKKEWNKKRKEPEESPEESGDIENKEM